MSQSSLNVPTTGPESPTAFAGAINAALTSIISKNSGTSAPANFPTTVSGAATAWMDWRDTTNIGASPSLVVAKEFDGTSWVTKGVIDATNHLWLPKVGGGTATIASAGSMDLGASPQYALTISGTTTITGFGASAQTGETKLLRFSGILTLTHNATSLVLPGAANITTAAGDQAIAVATGSGNWRVQSYLRADGTPLTQGYGGPLTSVASATTTDLGAVAGHNVSVTGTTTITSFGSSASVALPRYSVKFAGALTLTHNATSLILPGGANIVTAAGDSLEALYLGSGNWQVLSYARAAASAGNVTLAGATGIRIANNTGTPNTSIDVTWSTVVMVNASGIAVQNTTPTTVTIDATASGAVNQWDGTRPTSGWGYIWLISNGVTTGALGSASATAPTMPSGYTFKARVGAVRFDGSQNLLRTLQVGAKASYVVTAATNTAALPNMATGSAGSVTVPTWVAVSVSAFVPPTAGSIHVGLYVSSSSAQFAILAPNNSYGSINAFPSNPPAFSVSVPGGGTAYNAVSGEMLLESSNIYWANSSASNLYARGWVDACNVS